MVKESIITTIGYIKDYGKMDRLMVLVYKKVYIFMKDNGKKVYGMEKDILK